MAEPCFQPIMSLLREKYPFIGFYIKLIHSTSVSNPVKPNRMISVLVAIHPSLGQGEAGQFCARLMLLGAGGSAAGQLHKHMLQPQKSPDLSVSRCTAACPSRQLPCYHVPCCYRQGPCSTIVTALPASREHIYLYFNRRKISQAHLRQHSELQTEAAIPGSGV